MAWTIWTDPRFEEFDDQGPLNRSRDSPLECAKWYRTNADGSRHRSNPDNSIQGRGMPVVMNCATYWWCSFLPKVSCLEILFKRTIRSRFRQFPFYSLSSKPRSTWNTIERWDRRSIAILQWFSWSDNIYHWMKYISTIVSREFFEYTTHYLLPRRLKAVWQKDASTPSGIFECSARELGLTSLSIGRSISCLLLPPLAPFTHHSAGILARAHVNAHRPARPRN